MSSAFFAGCRVSRRRRAGESAGSFRGWERGRIAVFGLVLLFAGQAAARPAPGQSRAAFKISSAAFSPGGAVPKRFTCEGRNVSPPLEWTSPPAGTRSLVLMVLDPDAPSGTWTHWLIYDLPPTLRRLPENTPARPELPSGARQGRNDFGRLGFGGPCPPPGLPHRYFFRLIAVNISLHLAPGATRHEVNQAIRGHILGETELMGRFGR